MSVYSFRGGPWDGFVIEYGERVAPDDELQPGAADRPEHGSYLLDGGRRAYVWIDRNAGRGHAFWVRGKR